MRLEQRLAADIISTARQYPAIREARSFGALHDIYDANESILAAWEAEGETLWSADGTVTQEHLDRCNEATAAVDTVLRADGFYGLTMLAGCTCDGCSFRCPWSDAEECSMAAERSVAGTDDDIPPCITHARDWGVR